MATETSSTASAIRNLQDTPTWAVASVCFCLVLLSIILEKTIHLISNWLKTNKKKALVEVVEKLKSELMLLGFISLILAALQKPISNICIPSKYGDSMLPCPKTETQTGEQVTQHFKKSGNTFLYEDGPWHPHRLLASEGGGSTCADGKVSLVSLEGIHQLHIFIFVLAFTHLLSSLLTMALGRAKMRRWKSWEEETHSVSYQAANHPERFRFTRETTFARRHLGSWTKSSVLVWIKCFFRQFFHSVAKVDYLTLRHGFIKAHMPTNLNFNFRKYIQRSLDDDFKVVVGISPPLWLVAVILLLADVNGLHLYLWIAFVPLLIILFIGTKLEVILARMALQLKDQTAVIMGAPLVHPDDNLFWFSKPRFVLFLLHFTMFLNAFELAFTLWATWQFGISTCYNENIEVVIARVLSALIVHIICSYITLPIYALVTQMGSHYKSAILEEQTIASLKNWYGRVKNKQQGSTHHPLMSHLNPEIESSRKPSPMEISSRPTTQPTRALAETHSPPGDEISEAKIVPSGAAVVDLSGFEVSHETPSQFRKH
ncbi:MLO-like protein 3 [Macadamia integrifolia]|uniref:MLO-like protein 3 n=1 Tax=Macadamia integrifolia TaxID=60698 RepID=UPI001C52ED9B|nr:MLO-like protein 3 [Macadamia integrifolia]